MKSIVEICESIVIICENKFVKNIFAGSMDAESRNPCSSQKERRKGRDKMQVSKTEIDEYIARHGEEMVEFCDNARKKYYLRIGYILYRLRVGLKDPEDLKRSLKAFKSIRRFLFK